MRTPAIKIRQINKTNDIPTERKTRKIFISE